MKIAVIGTFVIDQIYTYQGKKVKSLGGISYSISSLANILSDRDEIYPIANVGAESYERIIDFLTQYKNIRTTGIHKEDKKNTRVTLKYYSKEARDEILQNRLSPISFEMVSKIGKVDVILINFITGFELYPTTCYNICVQNSALKYMDFHSLCLGIDNQGKRFPRKPENWEKWLIGIDILQMNENEAQILNEYDDLSSFVNKIFNHGIKIVNITLGSKGSLLFINQDKNMITEKVPPFAVRRVVDATGCGDAFAAGFITDFLKNKNAIKAAHNANRIAGLNCTLSGVEQINSLVKFENF